MTETLVQLAGDLAQGSVIGAASCCPECGSFLDAPRNHPGSGDLARKCAPCRDWYPVVSAPRSNSTD